MKKLFKKIMDFIANMFHEVEHELREEIVPTALAVTEVFKAVTDYDKADILGALAGKVGVTVENELKQILPLIIQDLDIMNLTLKDNDLNSLLLSVLKVVNNSTDRQKDAFYYNLEAMLIQDLADGKLTFAEAWELVIYWRANVANK